ncbi:XrtA system polysaccharide chain length determinant [Alkalimarinus alittae]|uniref:Wzz/FepE/Etk N-terminal domain-containing protein n=1 Tax=Alkalimarinus alittae TaxID=2961619 RepID=A0ABY6N781_9ALTE|nr:XrtA system polysaccharide chain length determinant [Alkalimarinus alittae]UZE97962.1 Wzz/FepE/Etk N-terminal domain-containing protein [Alkalimarinus alittae]
MQAPLGSVLREIIRELRDRKWSCLLVFMLVSALGLVVGIFWPHQYSASVTIYIDDQNIITPLMKGSAVQAKSKDKVAEATDIILGRKSLGRLVDYIESSQQKDLDEAQREKEILRLRGSINIRKKGRQFFEITYTDRKPDVAFLVTQKIGQLFLEIQEENRREESRNAYAFVDKQVKAYQSQLSQSEDRLRQFLTENADGTESGVQNKISQLKSQIELAELQQEELISQRESIRKQLRGVNASISNKVVSDKNNDRIKALQDRLEVLQLSYHDSYPDIVALKKQIEGIVEEAKENKDKPRSDEEIVSYENPLYVELSSQRAKTDTAITAVKTRIDSLNNLLNKTMLRMEKVQQNKAELAELTRDTDVNRNIYNDLLRRRETARVSMHLSSEGQGVSYVVHEPAVYPLKPKGPQFIHFALASILLGALAPIGLAGVYVQLDPRIRDASTIQENLEIPVLATIGKVITPREHRKERFKTVVIFIIGGCFVTLYLVVGWLKYTGAINA